MVRLNVAFLRRGLKLGTQYLLSVRGRKTGLPRSTPVSIATVDGVRFIVAAFPDAAWVKNIQVARAGTLERGRQKQDVRLVAIPVSEREPVLRAFLAQVRGGVRFFGRQTADEIVAGAERYPVFRIEPE